MLYDYAPWRSMQPPGWAGASNSLLIDSVTQLEPWLAYSAGRLHAGQLPLWNPANGLGAPLIGNMQSAVFFPLNWPFFLWPDGGLLAVRAWLKLVIAALGMYLLARQVARAGPLGASIAALTFACGGFITVWLLYPVTAVAIWLPWLWWATDRLVRRPGPGPGAALAALVALHLLAGHPETAYHIGLATSLFLLFQTWQTGPRQAGRVLRVLGWWAAAYGLGTLIAAVQLLPFLEYSSQSWAVFLRGERQANFIWTPFRYAWTLVSPDGFGSPVGHNWWGAPANYNEVQNYSGMLPLLLAPLALLLPNRAERRRLAGFLLALAGLALAIVYGAPGSAELVHLVPGMVWVFNIRLLLVAEFALALLAALGVSALVERLPHWRAAGLAVGGVALGWLIVGVGVPLLFAGPVFQVPDGTAAAQIWQNAQARAAVLILVSGAAIALIVGAEAARPRRAPILSGLLPLLLYADLWQAHSSYLPTVAPAAYFPTPEAIRFLQQQQPPGRLVATPDVLAANTNLLYGLADLRINDAVGPVLYYQLVARGDRTRRQYTPNYLTPSPIWNLLGVYYVLAAPGDDPNYVVDVRQETSTAGLVAAVPGAQEVGQTFVAGQDNLAGVQVWGTTRGGQVRGRLVFHLKTGPDAPTDLVTQTLDAAYLPDNSYWSLTFPPIREARGRSFYFAFTAPDAAPGPAAALGYSQEDPYPGGTRLLNGRPAAGDLAFRTLIQWEPDWLRFVRVLDGGNANLSIFENRSILLRARLVYRAAVEPDPVARVQRLYDPAWDMEGTVLLAAPLPANAPLPATPPTPGTDSATIVEDQPEAVTISTQSPAPGLLVLADQAFPGWEARVDGQPAPILTADHALRAVYLPAGSHTVRFVYQPLSFTLGALGSGGGLLLLLLLAGGAWRDGRH